MRHAEFHRSIIFIVRCRLSLSLSCRCQRHTRIAWTSERSLCLFIFGWQKIISTHRRSYKYVLRNSAPFKCGKWMHPFGEKQIEKWRSFVCTTSYTIQIGNESFARVSVCVCENAFYFDLFLLLMALSLRSAPLLCSLFRAGFHTIIISIIIFHRANQYLWIAWT